MKSIFILWTVVLAGALALSAQHPKRTESFWQTVRRFLGISVNPGALRGGDGDAPPGDIWTVDVERRTNCQLTSGAAYRSPMFYPDGKSVLAMRGEELERIPLSSGEPEALFPAPEVEKLVGFSQDDHFRVLSVLRGNRIGILSLSDRTIVPLDFDSQSEEDAVLFLHLKYWDRVYDDVTVFTQSLASEAHPYARTGTDVFLRAGDSEPKDLSRCQGSLCGQASLSSDHRRVVYIRVPEE